MSDTPPEIITRKVRVIAPMAGEIEVTIDLTGVIERLAKSAAKHAYLLHRGWSEAQTPVFAPTKAVCTSETIIARKAHCALNNEKREQLRPKFEVLPPS